MRSKILGLLVVGMLAGPMAANAAIYTEDFESVFPAWESGWFGQNSTAKNYYGVGQARGSFLDGLGLQSVNGAGSGGDIDFSFSDSFAPLITSFELDVGSYRGDGVLQLWAYDVSGNQLFFSSINNGNPYADPGTFQHFTITSSNGIKRLFFNNSAGSNPSENAGGAIAIDNLKVTTSEVSPVPLPAAAWLLLSGLGGLGFLGRRRKA